MRKNRKQALKIGVLTFFNYCNFGAALQSYALYRVLRQLGEQVEYLDYTCPFIGNPYTLKSLKKRGLWGFIYTVAGRFFYAPRKRLFAAFRKKIPHTEPLDPGNIGKYGDRYDLYITGSDQLWNAELTDFDKTYFLDFVKDPRKKYSYAVSFGGKELKEEDKAGYRRLLSDFAGISVREEYGKELVESLTGKEAAVLPDPTMLLTGEQWKKVASPKKSGKSYILAYQMGFTRSLIDAVKRAADQFRLPVSYIPFPLGGFVPGRYHLRLGPRQWLAQFRDASYIVTDSFHGIVFAILFEKPFAAVVDGQHKNQRAISLLTHLGLTDRIVQDGRIPDPEKEIDYGPVRQILHADRKAALSWLNAVLDCRKRGENG